MGKKLWFIVLWAFFLLIQLRQPVESSAEPKVRAEAAALIDGYTGNILWEKNGHELRHPASTIKILTTLIALEQNNLSDQVHVGKKAGQTYVGQTIGLMQGDLMTVEDLIEASLLWSANDAAVALGEHMAGDPQMFTLLMNQKAWALGAFNSSFRNPNGYSVPGQYSTAYDLALFARAAMRDPFFCQTVAKPSAEIKWLNKNKSQTINNTNKLLNYYPGANGVKTGTTDAAGGCLIASAVKGDKWYIAAVLGSSRRYADATSMLDYGMDTFSVIAVEPGKVFNKVKIGESKFVETIPRKGLYYSFPQKSAAEWKVTTNITRQKAPIKKGQVIGTVEIYFCGKLQDKTELIAKEGIKYSLFGR